MRQELAESEVGAALIQFKKFMSLDLKRGNTGILNNLIRKAPLTQEVVPSKLRKSRQVCFYWDLRDYEFSCSKREKEDFLSTLIRSSACQVRSLPYEFGESR
jgi:hypothetical protein